MKALIAPMQPVESGYRVAEISADGFEVAEPLFWVECPDDTVADKFWFDPRVNVIKPIPVSEPAQPVVTGAQEL